MHLFDNNHSHIIGVTMLLFAVCVTKIFTRRESSSCSPKPICSGKQISKFHDFGNQASIQQVFFIQIITFLALFNNLLF